MPPHHIPQGLTHTQKTRWHRDPLKVSHHTVFFNIEECEWRETVGERGNDTLKCQRGQVKAAFVTLLHSWQREDSIISIQTNYRRSSAARGPHRHNSAPLLNMSDMIRYKEMDSSEKQGPNQGKVESVEFKNRRFENDTSCSTEKMIYFQTDKIQMRASTETTQHIGSPWHVIGNPSVLLEMWKNEIY